MIKRSVTVAAVAVLLVGCGGDDTKAPPSTAATPPMNPTVVAPMPTPTPSPTSAVTTPPPATKMSMMEMQQKAGMAFDAGYNAHDAKKIAEIYATDGVVAHLSDKGWEEVKGRDAIEKHTAAFFAAYPDAKTGAERVFASKNVMAVQWAWTGTHKGDLGELKATNKPAGVHGFSILWFDDAGLVTKEHVYMDFGTILAQEGISKAKPRPLATVPTAKPDVIVSKDDDVEKKNGEAGNKFLDAFNKHDTKALLASITDDVVDSELAQPEDVKGAKAYEKSHAAWFKSFPDAKLTVDQGWAAGDWLIGEGTFVGTQKGAMGPFKATNKPVNAHYAQVARFKDGKLAEAYTYYATAEMLEQLGLLPKPADAKAPDAKPPAKSKDVK